MADISLLQQQKELYLQQIEALKELKKLQRETGMTSSKVGKEKKKHKKKHREKEKKKKASSSSKKARKAKAASPSPKKRKRSAVDVAAAQQEEKSVAKKRRKRASIKLPGNAQITIISPKTGATIKVGCKKSKAFKDLVEDARRVKFTLGQPETERLVNALSQCQSKGLTQWDSVYIPAKVQKAASKLSGVPYKGSRASSSASSSSGSEEEGDRPKQVDNFMGKFITYRIDMTGSKYGEGMIQDLAKVQHMVTEHLKSIRENTFKGKPMKVYMEYDFFMTRNPWFNVQTGQVTGQPETQEFNISSASNQGSLIDIRSVNGCEAAVSRMLSILQHEFADVGTRGSGWKWERSLGMNIKVNRKVDRVPMKGNAADRQIENIIAREEASLPASIDIGQGEKGGAHLPLPAWLRKTGRVDCFFNPKPMTYKKADDNLCFSWCILRALNLYGVKDPETGQYYEGLDRFNERFHRAPGQQTNGMGYKQMGNVGDLAEAVAQGVLRHVSLPEGVEYPVPVKETLFEEVERLNGISLSVFMLGSNEDEFYPFFASRCMQEGKPHVRLAILQSRIPPKLGKEGVVMDLNRVEVSTHFVLVLDMEKLLGGIAKRYGTRFRDGLEDLPDGTVGVGEDGRWELQRTLYCDNCLNRFSSLKGSQSFLEHQRGCLFDKPTDFALPVKDRRFLQFKNFKYTEMHPFVIYADLEAVNTPPDNNGAASSPVSTTTSVSRHRVSCWAYQIVVADKYRHLFENEVGALGKPFREIRSMVGEDIMGCFFDALKMDTDIMHDIVKGDKGNVPMYPDEDDESMIKALFEAKKCRFCYNELPDPKTPVSHLPSPTLARVLDHDHFTGEFRGVAHAGCNIKASISKHYCVPVVFHNLKGYDGYHILRSLAECKSDNFTLEETNPDHIEVIAKSMEKFTSITLNKRIRFIDSLQFMLGSLDTLVRNLDNSLYTLEKKAETFRMVLEWNRVKVSREDRVCPEHPMDPTDIVWIPCDCPRPPSTGEALKFLTKKGVYPYEYAETVEELFTTTSLPDQAAFESRLRGPISDGEYRRAATAWHYFECKSLADYTASYCELDVLLLACVFESFRKSSLDTSGDEPGYGLDPAHFITAPSLSFSALLLMLLKKGIKIETFSDENVGMDGFLMAEAGIRGGITQVFHPLAQGNYLPVPRDLLPEGVEGTEENDWERADLPEVAGQSWDDGLKDMERHLLSDEQHVLYIDANNLYGRAMVEPMPIGDYIMEKTFSTPSVSREARMASMSGVNALAEAEDGAFTFEPEVLQQIELSLMWASEDMHEVAQAILGLEDDAARGYLFEVDLDYPTYLHDDHNDLPFCPQSKLPPNPSPFTRQQFAMYGSCAESALFRTPKLILDLMDKKNYVIHYRLLKLALKHGLVLAKVHRVMSFKQSKWLKDYIDFNTKKRGKAKNAVEKDFWKLMNNSIFGKMMENVRARRSVDFVFANQWAKAVKVSGCSPCSLNS